MTLTLTLTHGLLCRPPTNSQSEKKNKVKKKKGGGGRGVLGVIFSLDLRS